MPVQRDEIDYLIQRLQHANYPSDEDIEEARWLRNYLGKTGFIPFVRDEAFANVPKILEKYKHRLMLADYKDAKRAGLDPAKFLPNIFDLGDGEIDFPGCHRVLKSMAYKGWICVDLDTARKGPRASYERCGAYVVDKLEPIYV